MAETVYLFGAGINREVVDWGGIRPPLAKDFFCEALKHPRFAGPHYISKLEIVFEYIKRYWKLGLEHLKTYSFDLEECFTLLQLQKLSANRDGDINQYSFLAKVESRLALFFAEFLGEFEHKIYSSNSFLGLGKLLFEQRPSIITFNYDTLLEEAIECASGLTQKVPSSLNGKPGNNQVILDDQLAYSHFQWNRPLAYGVEFDEVQLQRAGVPRLVPAAAFYRHRLNKMYESPLLKLHGSLNWSVCLGVERYASGRPIARKPGRTLLYQGRAWLNEPADIEGELIEPLLVMPALYKQFELLPIISQLWSRAKSELEGCRRLIVGGYSFPPTDFHAKRLFLESFVQAPPEELVVINPDKRIDDIVSNLCHFRRGVTHFDSLEQFMSLYDHKT